LIPAKPGNFEFGFTRGYLTSQAYAERFQNKDIRQEPKTLDYETQPFQAQYEWLGYHARKLIFTLLKFGRGFSRMNTVGMARTCAASTAASRSVFISENPCPMKIASKKHNAAILHIVGARY
jgi:hypothetical protein